MSLVLIENGIVMTLNDKGDVFQPGYVWVENDRILEVAVGKPQPEQKNIADMVINAHLMVVMPGMVNSHTHLFQTFIRGLADDKPLLEWLRTAIWPVAQEMNEEEAYFAARLGLVENLRSGVTAVIDHQYIHADPRNDDGVFRAADETGLRLLLARGWTDINYAPMLMETQERILSESTRLYETYHGKADGRLRFEFGPLIPWGCTDESMHKTYALARQWGVGVHIHVAETREEVQMNIESRGLRHIEWLDRLGILGPDIKLVHSVWLDDAEQHLIAKKGAIVVHCPVSNMYLASGAAPVANMHKLGIQVALATDGPGSNNNQDMLEVLKTTALLAKVSTLDAMALMPDDVLHMACRHGAAAFGQPDLIGSLEPGKKADIVLVDLDTPFAMPVHNPASALVYNLSGGAVDTVMVDGKLLIRNKEILCLDEKSMLEDARQACKKLFTRAGVVNGS
jgi:5-methylthioadenosine/S-adenosylhomocysteine deaminase